MAVPSPPCLGGRRHHEGGRSPHRLCIAAMPFTPAASSKQHWWGIRSSWCWWCCHHSPGTPGAVQRAWRMATCPWCGVPPLASYPRACLRRPVGLFWLLQQHLGLIVTACRSWWPTMRDRVPAGHHTAVWCWVEPAADPQDWQQALGDPGSAVSGQ